MINLEEIFTAYKECRKRKRRTINAITFERNLFVNCYKLLQDINQRKYNPTTSITFIVTRPKPREIFAANFRDRVVHHIIMQSIGYLFEEEFITSTFNCRKNKGVNYGVQTLHDDIQKCSENYTKNCYVARFDLKGFFMTINKTILKERLFKFISERYEARNKEDILYLIDTVVSHCPEKNCERRSTENMWKLIPADKSLFTVGDNFGLPIGNLTSQIFANFYLNEFDHLLKNEFGYYGRYVDDFYIVSYNKDHILNFVPTIRKYLMDSIGVVLHPNKFYMQNYSKGCDFTGSTVKGKIIYTGNRTYLHCREVINQYNPVPGNKLAEKFTTRLNSYFGFMRNRASFNMKNTIITEIKNRWWKYISINDKQVFHSNSSFIKRIQTGLIDGSYFNLLY